MKRRRISSRQPPVTVYTGPPPGLPEVTLYTDGSWRNNLGFGGWSCLISGSFGWRLLTGNEQDTTISRMELTAVLTGLQAIPPICSVVTVISDSTYVVNCINGWIGYWRMHGWRKARSHVLVENVDLLTGISDAMAAHWVSAVWVKSHTKNKSADYLGNSVVDWFAQNSSLP